VVLVSHGLHPQLGDVGGDAPSIVAGEELGRRTPTGRVREIDVGERRVIARESFALRLSAQSAMALSAPGADLKSFAIARREAGVLLVDRPR
jgi:hypothetical protein